MQYHLAIDQGGTKTDALVFTQDGSILGIGNDRAIRTHSDNYQAQQAQFIRVAAENALKAANVSIADIASVRAALNGADWAHDYPRLQSLTARALIVPEEIVSIINDCIGAMRGGTAEPRCAVVCVGTGLNCAAQNECGEQYIYGYFIPNRDQGALALGESAWCAMTDEWNGMGLATAITPEVLRQYNKPDTQTLYIAFTDGEIPYETKDMAVPLMRAAEAGDREALRIIGEMSERLAKYVNGALRKVGLSGQALPLVISGGVTKGKGHVLTDSIKRHMAQLQPQVRCVSAEFEPIAGTALLTLDVLHASGIPNEVMHNFRGDAGRLGLLRQES